MGFAILDRKYLIGGKWFRFEKMKNYKGVFGWKIAIGRYELRHYKKKKVEVSKIKKS